MCRAPKIQDLHTTPSLFHYSKGSHETCPLDPAPTFVVLRVLDVLLSVITCMINMSFESGLFAEEWRQALVLPTLKKCGLDIAYKTFAQ